MLLVCGIPVSISVIDSTPGMFVFTCFFAMLLLSTIVTFFVQHVDKYMKTNYKQRILPRPEETEEKNEIVIDNPMNTEKESIDAYSELESDIDIDLEMIDV
jgi:GH25 family lysozyme M1 (1,4-beta-N-acetylmuramidase)